MKNSSLKVLIVKIYCRKYMFHEIFCLNSNLPLIATAYMRIDIYSSLDNFPNLAYSRRYLLLL